jgi:hypothetical protein
LIDSYPEPNRFGITPSYGFFIRNVKDLKMSDVYVHFMKDEQRPAFILDHVQGADLQHIRAQKVQGVSTFVLKDVIDFSLINSGAVPDTKLADVANKEL